MERAQDAGPSPSVTGEPPAAAVILDALAVGVYVVGSGGLIEFVSARASAVLGWTTDQLLGMPAHEVLHSDSGLAGQCRILEVLRTGVPATSETDLLRRADGSLVEVWWSATPIADTTSAESLDAFGSDETGRSVVVAFNDITERQVAAVSEAAEREQRQADLILARRSVSDLGWIGELIQVVSATLDEHEALSRLARLMVPRLADIAVVDQIAPTGELTRVTAAAAPGVDVDVARVLALPEVAHCDGGRSPLTTATIAGGTVLHFDREKMADPTLLENSSRRLLAELGAQELLIVPLGARSHTVGVLGLVRRTGSAHYGPNDRLLAADVARRAGLALDNARLYRIQAANSAALQRALLPELALDPSMPAAARYLPARDVLDVGGDWYDVFGCPHIAERRVLVIGDVAGHDLGAATRMATLRNLLRGVTITVDQGPAAVLDAVDANLEVLGVRGTATCVVLTAEPQGDDAWLLRWSNAGHHPPVLVAPGNGVQVLGGNDALLGAGARRPRTEEVLVAPAGSTLLMYTDGLIENRLEDIDVGYTRLRRALTALPPDAFADPDELLDTLMQRLPGSLEDDTAVLAVHLPAR